MANQDITVWIDRNPSNSSEYFLRIKNSSGAPIIVERATLEHLNAQMQAVQGETSDPCKKAGPNMDCSSTNYPSEFSFEKFPTIHPNQLFETNRAGKHLWYNTFAGPKFIRARVKVKDHDGELMSSVLKVGK